MASQPVFFDNPQQFRDWLEQHAATANELVVGFHKAATGRERMTWSESVDEALCFGWIDGVRRRIDDHGYSIRFTPRKPTSTWSAINIAKYQALLAQGRMTAAGTAAFGHRRDDRSAIYSHEQPDTADLTAAEWRQFKRNKTAWAYWAAVPPGYRKLALHRVTSVKRPATRASRLVLLIDACAIGKRL